MSARRRTLTRGAALACCVLATVALTGCGSADNVATASAPPAVQRFPDVLSAELVPDSDGRYDVSVFLTKAIDYGKIRISINGKDAGKELDLFNDGVIPWKTDLGKFDIKKGDNRLVITITGANPKAIKKFMVGLDYLLLKK